MDLYMEYQSIYLIQIPDGAILAVPPAGSASWTRSLRVQLALPSASTALSYFESEAEITDDGPTRAAGREK